MQTQTTLTVLTLLSKIVTGRRRLVIKLIMYTQHDYSCVCVCVNKHTKVCAYVYANTH